MPSQILYPQWRAQFESTKYPFSTWATLGNSAGDFFVEGTFLDAQLYPIGGKERLFLSRVVISYNQAVLWIGDPYNDSLASATFVFSDPVDSLALTDGWGRPAGVLVSEAQRLAVFQTWGAGTHVFENDETEFCTTCCMPVPEVGVRGILLEDGSVLTGKVYIFGSDGVVLSENAVTHTDSCTQVAVKTSTIRVDIVGDPLFRRRLCQDTDNTTLPDPIRGLRFIQGDHSFEMTPDSFGTVFLTTGTYLAADSVLRVRTTGDGVTIETVGSVNAG